MSLAALKVKKPSTVIGIDASSNSFAYCYGVDGVPKEWGIVNYKGKDRFQRALDSYYKVEALFGRIGRVDLIVQEQSVGSLNTSTGLILAQAYGVTMKTLLEHTGRYEMVNPNEWQAWLGIKAKSPTLIKKEHPSATKSWLNEEARKERKRRNLKFVKETFGIDLPYEANDVSDAIGIFAFACRDVS